MPIFSTAFSQALNSDQPGWVNYTLRQRLVSGMFAATGDIVRITIRSSNAGGFSITDAFIGVRGAGVYDFASTPTRLTFDGGSSTKVVGTATDAVTDEIAFPITGSDDIIVSIFFTAGTPSNLRRIAPPTADYGVGYKAGNVASALTDTFGTDSTGIMVKLFEVAPASTTAEADFVISYEIEAAPVSQSLVLSYEIEAASAAQSLVLDYRIFTAVSRSLVVSYEVGDNRPDAWAYWGVSVRATGAAYGGPLYGPGASVPTEYVAPTDGPRLSPDVRVRAASGSSLMRGFAGDFYYRIWVDPVSMVLANPRIGIGQPFVIWNAYPSENTLQTIGATDLDGVDLSIAAPATFGRYEFREIELTITTDAPATLDGLFTFDFDVGTGFLPLTAIVIPVLQTLPMEPVIERWAWNAPVLMSYNGREQRHSLRAYPVVTVSYSMRITTEAERRSLYAQFMRYYLREVATPMFQYVTELDAPAADTDYDLFFDVSLLRLRSGEYLAILDIHDVVTIHEIETVNADGVTLTDPVGFPVTLDHRVMPVYFMHFTKDAVISMGAVDGVMSIEGRMSREYPLQREDAAPSLVSYGGRLLMDARPVARTSVQETLEGDITSVTNGIRMPQLYSGWAAPFVGYKHELLLDRDTDMDWLRAFFEQTRAQDAFYMASWRDDLPLAAQPDLGAVQIRTTNTDALSYILSENYKHLQIETKNGTVYREVIDAAVASGEMTITMAVALGSSEGDNEIERISFLNLCRLDKPEVTLTHYNGYTVAGFTVRSVLE